MITTAQYGGSFHVYVTSSDGTVVRHWWQAVSGDATWHHEVLPAA